MTKQNASKKEKIVTAALALAGTQGWDNVTFYDIANKTKIPLVDLFDLYNDKSEFLETYGKMVDRQVLENLGKPDDSLSCRDRLFDILMDRFDALNDNRAGLVSVLNSFKGDPKQALFTLPHLGKSMNGMLEASGIKTEGIGGCVRITGLTGLYLKTLRTWMRDDSEDMAKTMAALDNNLGRAEKFSNIIGL